MRTIAQSQSSSFRKFRVANLPLADLPVDFKVVCLVAAAGLALTGLLCSLGLGSDIAQALTLD